MGKLALYILLVAANLAFLAWVYVTSRRRSSQNNDATDASRNTTRGASFDDLPVEKEVVTDCAAGVAPGFQDLSKSIFLVPPMVQIGRDASRLDCVDVLFFAMAEMAGFSIEAFTSDRRLTVSDLSRTPICMESVPPHARHAATISGLKPGEEFTYRVRRAGELVFEAKSRARKGANEGSNFVVVGDMGNGSVEASRIAYQVWKVKPDYVAITGDVVYMHGRASEYLRRFLPVYNATVADPNIGAPILSSTPSFTSVGNHCVGKTEYFYSPTFTHHDDLHAFFLYWSLPLNGPLGDAKATVSIPELIGDTVRIQRFLKAAGDRFPRMANYSLDYGNVHWLTLDANSYMDWTAKQLRDWVDADLGASKARWKVVNLHQPPFTSNPKHKQEKRMRLLVDLFQKHGVKVVFCGHAHYYERTYPLNFTVQAGPDGKLIDENGQVHGQFAIDKSFDGETNTSPNGIVYIVTGGGGSKLDPSGVHWRPDLWEPFTHKLIGDRHSFTACSVDDHTFSVRQIDMTGKEIDRFVITQ